MALHTVTFFDPLSRRAFGPFSVATKREFAFLLGTVCGQIYAMPREIGWQFEGAEPDFVAGYPNTRYEITKG